MKSTGREARTPDTWFWRPVLYRLSYSRVFPSAKVSIYFGITGFFRSFLYRCTVFDVLPRYRYGLNGKVLLHQHCGVVATTLP